MTEVPLHKLPIMCNFKNTLDIYRKTELNFMNQEVTKILTAWLHPNNKWYFIWYRDEITGNTWCAYRGSKYEGLEMSSDALHTWEKFANAHFVSIDDIKEGTKFAKALSQAYININFLG